MDCCCCWNKHQYVLACLAGVIGHTVHSHSVWPMLLVLAVHVYDGEVVVPHDSDEHDAAAAAAADMATTLPLIGQLQCSDTTAALSSVAWQVQESEIRHTACAAAAPDGTVVVWQAMPEAGGVASAEPLAGPRAGPDAWAAGRAAPCADIAWDPFGALRGVAATPAGLLTWDARAGKTQAVAAAAAANSCGVSCVSYNPSKAHMLITGDAQGQYVSCAFDRAYLPRSPAAQFTPRLPHPHSLRLFDDRNFGEPVQTLLCSSAAMSGVAFNPAHDQLVLASSADTTTQLWRLSTQSSAPMLSDEGGKVAADGLVACDIDLRDCSVMGVAWSGSSPWCYASLTYDGRLAMSTVPDKEKYRIML